MTRNSCQINLIHTFFCDARILSAGGNYICIGFSEAFDLMVHNLIIKNENKRKSAQWMLNGVNAG